MLAAQEGGLEAEQKNAKQRILHYSHHRGAILGGYDLFGDSRNLFQLRQTLVALRHVHIHLIPVEVGIVWRADG